MEETSGKATEEGSLSQNGQTCNRCYVYRINQHRKKKTVWTTRMRKNYRQTYYIDSYTAVMFNASPGDGRDKMENVRSLLG